MVDLATMTPEKRERYYRYLQLKGKDAGEPVVVEEDTGRLPMPGIGGQTQLALDVGGQAVKGLGLAAEGIADISDIVIEPIRTWAGGGTMKEGFEAGLNEMNPFSEVEGEGDRMRREVFRETDQPVGQAVDFLTKERISNQVPGLQTAKTGAELFGSMMGPGKVKDVMQTAAVAAGGAAAGEEIGGETGEMIGGITGGISNIQNWGPKAVKGMGNYLRKKFGFNVENQNVERAIDFLKQNADNWDEAIANLNEADRADIIGTLGDLTEDFQLMNIENVPKGSPVAHAIEDTTKAREGQIIEQLREGFGAGDPEAARRSAQMATADELRDINLDEANQAAQIQKELRNQVSDIQEVPALAQRQAAQADEAAILAEQTVGVDLKPSRASEIVSEEMGKVDASLLEELQNPAWKTFDDLSEGINAKEAQSVLENIKPSGKDSLHATAKADLQSSFPSIFKLVNNLGETATPSQIHYIVQKAKNAVHQNKLSNKGKATPEARSLTIYAKELEKLIKKGDAGEAYEAAVTATNRRLERVASGTVGEARALDPKLVGKELFKSVEQGAVTAVDIRAFDKPEVTKSVKDYIRSVARRDGVDEAFITKYGEFLDEFPDLKKELAGVVSAKGEATVLTEAAAAAGKKADKQSTALTQTMKQQAARVEDTAKGLRTAVGKTIASDYGKDPTKTIKKMLTNPDDIEKLPDLIKTVDDAAGVKAAIGDAVNDILTSGTGTRRRIDYRALEEFEKIRPQLEQVMTTAEFDKFKKVLERTRTSEYRKLSASQKTDLLDSEMANLGSSIAAAAVVGGLPGTQSLLVGGAVRRFFRKRLFGGAKADPKVAAVLDDIIANPRKYIEDLNKAKVDTPEKFNRYMAAMVGGIAQTQDEEE